MPYIEINNNTGCSAGASALGSGPRCRRFKSAQPDYTQGRVYDAALSLTAYCGRRFASSAQPEVYSKTAPDGAVFSLWESSGRSTQLIADFINLFVVVFVEFCQQ